jgi:cytochrome c-type biogenesis protein CcmE
MNAVRKKRLLWIGAIVLVVAGVVGAVIQAFNDNLVFFYTPSELLAGKVPPGKSYRLGGMVEVGSIQKEAGTLKIGFTVSDKTQQVPVTYSGILPDLFKEGTGVVAEGQYKDGVFVAHTILAKHDENYMPPGVQGK